MFSGRAAWGFMAAMALAATLCCGAVAQPGATKRSARTGAVATATQMPLVDLAGYERVVTKYRGRPLLVTFWATWCEPCETEYPMLVQLARQYAPQGLATIGVNMDDDSDLKIAHDFLAKNKPGFPNFRQKPGIDLDSFYRGVNPDWSGAMPETIFYNRNGTIAGHFIGLRTRNMYEQAIHVILASPTAGGKSAAAPSGSRGR
ncbi:MAG TPA: TlpA disulfide reductase family protein [Candidatus Acidoferrum sp.]|nr:TlpA disulfide reductase family protein [Candidatus Acidoferrum sp.]